MIPKLALFLRDYWKDRGRLCHQLGKELALDDLVFASVEGKPLDPGVVSHNFSRMAKRAGLGWAGYCPLPRSETYLCQPYVTARRKA
jgi:hypothetical protein